MASIRFPVFISPVSPAVPMPNDAFRPAAMREQLLHECVAMARYALASGMPVPATAADAIEKARFVDSNEPLNMGPVVKAHDQLSRLVAPATPRALLALGEEHSTSRIAWLGSVGLVRRMLGAAVFSVLLFMALSALPQTTIGNVKDWQNGDGIPVLVNDLFLMAAAAIGASFAMLMQVNGYIVKRTYDPKYEPTYWIKFILGVMAGFILVALLPNTQESGSSALTLPALAMLGGFSASAVYRILAKMVESVEAVFRGSPAEEMAQRERAAQTRATEEVSQARLRVAAQIVSLQQQVSSGADPATLTQALSGVLNSLAPTGGEQPAPPPAEQPAPAAPAPAPAAATVSLPNIPIVSAPEQVAPAAVTEEPAPPPAAADAPAVDDAPDQAAAPAAAYVGGDSDEDMSGGDESGEAGPSAAAPAPDTGEDDGSQTGAVG